MRETKLDGLGGTYRASPVILEPNIPNIVINMT